MPTTAKPVPRRHRVRLYPTPQQAVLLRAWSDVCTWIWNSALEQRQRLYSDYTVRETTGEWCLVYAPRHARRSHPDEYPHAHRPDGATLSSGRTGAPIWAQGLPARTPVYHRGTIVEGQVRQLQDARSTIPELGHIPAQVANTVLYQLDKAYQHAFRRVRESRTMGRPRYRSSRRVRISLPSYGQTHQIVGRDTETHYLFLSRGRGESKPTAIKVRSHIPLTGHDLGEMTVWEEHGQWHGSIVIRDPPPRSAGAQADAIGLNRGVIHFATLSNGERLEGFAGDPPLEKWLLRRERDAARKWRTNNKEHLTTDGRRKPGHRFVRSASERKVRHQIGKLSAQLARKRHEELHLIANDLLDGYHTICIEDLDIQHLTVSPHGTSEHPGTNVRYRSQLNRRILAQGWGEFARILEYKAHERGNQIIRVDPKHISRECPECGTVLDHNPSKRTRTFRCRACKHQEDVDVVAARNILRRGLNASGEVRA